MTDNRVTRGYLLVVEDRSGRLADLFHHEVLRRAKHDLLDLRILMSWQNEEPKRAGPGVGLGGQVDLEPVVAEDELALADQLECPLPPELLLQLRDVAVDLPEQLLVLCCAISRARHARRLAGKQPNRPPTARFRCAT